MNLDELRKRIDELDKKLVQLLNDRTRIVMEIGEAKRKSGEEIYVPAREREVLDKVTRQNTGPLPNEAVQAVYREIMSAALALEQGVRVAYLGPSATFTHQAARQRFGASVEYVSCETIGDIFSAVQKRSAHYGVVPIENSSEGAVTHTFDELVATPLKVCAEIYLPISHHLMSTSARADIKRITSKFEVFGQCRRWLNQQMPGVELITASSTAKAAETAAKEPGTAAIASELAAEIYGLTILSRDIQDMAENTTRFLVIGRASGKATGQDRTSVFFVVKDRVGALNDVLATLKSNQINMTSISSRPSRNKAWEYCFFIDIEGHADDPHVQAALEQLSALCQRMTVLGSYPRAAAPA